MMYENKIILKLKKMTRSLKEEHIEINNNLRMNLTICGNRNF